MTSALCQEAVAFFHSAPIYEHMLQAIKKRMQQLGRIGGTITLTRLTPDDRQALESFFGSALSAEEPVRIGLQDVVKALQTSRFVQVSLVELIEAYFGEQLITVAEQEERWQNDWEEFFTAFLEKYPHEPCQRWLTELLHRRGPGYRLILKHFKEQPNVLRNHLTIVCTALCHLPVHQGKVIRLPIFASETTTDPHGLDSWTDAGKLFQAALAVIYEEPMPMTGEELTLLYKRGGILKGDISSYVTTFGLCAYQKDQTASSLEGSFGFTGSLQLTLDNLLRVDRVVSRNGRVYVLENPAVFAELVEVCGERNHSLICSNGQFRLATWVLLDLLVAEGVEIYYSGDFDPEGLGIAQRLLDRYPEAVTLWHYTREDYQQALSEIDLPEQRLSKLGKIVHENLVVVRDEMLRLRKAGYQENLVVAMLKSIQM